MVTDCITKACYCWCCRDPDAVHSVTKFMSIHRFSLPLPREVFAPVTLIVHFVLSIFLYTSCILGSPVFIFCLGSGIVFVFFVCSEPFTKDVTTLKDSLRCCCP